MKNVKQFNRESELEKIVNTNRLEKNAWAKIPRVINDDPLFNTIIACQYEDLTR